MRPVFRFTPMQWPVAHELARSARPIGVAVVRVGQTDEVDAVVIDVDGVLWCLTRGERRSAMRWCLDRALRVHSSVGELAAAMRRGDVFGWVHGPLGPVPLWPFVGFLSEVSS